MDEFCLREGVSYLDATGTEWLILCVDGGAAFASSGGDIPHAMFTTEGGSMSLGVPNIVAQGKAIKTIRK